jgi:hypothetical protein
MSNAHKICREFAGSDGFAYGGLEETIGFIFDNYYQAMKIYRAIIFQKNEIEARKVDAHESLQKLRDDEERWKRTKKQPKNFDAEEHQKRKDYLVGIRDAEYYITYNGSPIEKDKLGNLIYRNLNLFYVLHSIDSGTRTVLGPLSRRALTVALWPMKKMIQLTIKYSDSAKEKKYLKVTEDFIEKIPTKIESKIIL